MADTRPTRVSVVRAAWLCVLGILAPDRLEIEQQKDNAARNQFTGQNPREALPRIVRRAFWSSLLLVAASAGGGYALGWLSTYFGLCAPPTFTVGLQVVGAGLLLWGTLFVRGWEIQTFAGVTLVERVNRWLYRAMYCLGTGLVVLSLAISPCVMGSTATQAQTATGTTMSFGWFSRLLAANWWAGIGALATVAAAVGIVFAIRQLRFDAWLKAQEIFVDRDFTEARGRIFRHLDAAPATWDSEDQKAGLLVCRRLDEFCRLAPYFAFRKSHAREVVLEVWAVPLGRLWALLNPLLKAERDKVRWGTKWNAFEGLAGEAFNRLSPDEQRTLNEISERLTPDVRQLRGVPPKTL